MGAKKPKVKKGPKGKKARAKAKLEQVWGEHVDEEARQASKFRKGKSRLTPATETTTTTTQQRRHQKEKEVDPLSTNRRGLKTSFESFLERKDNLYQHEQEQKLKQRQYTHQKKNKRYNAAHNDESSDEDDSDEEMGGVDSSGGSLSHLLKRINGPKKSSSRKIAVESDDDDDSNVNSDAASDDDDDTESVSSASSSFSNQSHSDSDDDDMDMVAEENIDLPKGAAEDPYEAHFSKKPLPQLDSTDNTNNLMPHLAKSSKANTSSLLSSSMQVHLSGPILDSFETLTGSLPDKTKPKQMWKAFARGPQQHTRQVLSRNWNSVNRNALKRSQRARSENENDISLSPLQQVLYPAISNYADVLISMESRQNRNEINNLLTMHVLNHVLTSRSRVQKHNRRIKQLAEVDDDAADEEDDDQWRDQGYTRPKVLLLFPTRGTCWAFVQNMIELLGDSALLEMEDRFEAEYGPIKREKGSEEEEDKEKARVDAIMKQKGREWNELFGEEANDDDDFKIGISLTPNVDKKKIRAKKGATVTSSGSGVKLRLFADFFHSDIILASPIGLKMSTTHEESDDEGEDDTADVDFLSSIEMCIVARSDVLMMQNWDHVNSVLNSLNQQPKNVSNIDFSRVRNYFLEGQGKYWRQMIVVSAFTDPYVTSTFRRHAKNIEGQLRIRKKVSTDNASICDVMVRVKQVFQRVTCPTVSEAGSARLRFFSEHVLPKLQRLQQKHTLIYIPSYFDFVAVRNLLLKREVKFVSVTEYARVSEVSRGRARFLQGVKPIMLYTGRAHFFLRHKIKGARHLIFFGLPEYDEFYPSVVNMLNEGLTSEDEDDVSRLPMSSLSLFTKFDAHQLERIVGTSHAERMIKGDKSSYVFAS